MFLLNGKYPAVFCDFANFTIQNVSIKFETKSDQFATYVSFTIQNVSIKWKKGKE